MRQGKSERINFAKHTAKLPGWGKQKKRIHFSGIYNVVVGKSLEK
jgi:hypothetical protein